MQPYRLGFFELMRKSRLLGRIDIGDVVHFGCTWTCKDWIKVWLDTTLGVAWGRAAVGPHTSGVVLHDWPVQ